MENRKNYRRLLRMIKRKVDEIETPRSFLYPTEPVRPNEWIVGRMDKYEKKLFSVIISETEKLDELEATEPGSEETERQERKIKIARKWLFIYSRLNRRFLLFPEYRMNGNKPVVVEKVQKENAMLDLEISLMIAEFLNKEE